MEEKFHVGLKLPIPTSLVGTINIGEDSDLLQVKAFIYRGNSIAFDLETKMFGANQAVSVEGVATFVGNFFISEPITPKQRGASSRDLYRVVITFDDVGGLNNDEVPVEGSWALIKINGTEPHETFAFDGELSLRR
jgi:hypothetical protein